MNQRVIKKVRCNICSAGCPIDAYVEEGTLVSVEGSRDLPGQSGGLCSKGAASRQYVYNKDRILYPMKRIGKKGSGEFERISWDEAYRMIAENLLRIKKEYGPQAAVLQLEDMLGIKIDHYVKVDFNALVEIVDAVGGVEVDVPRDMKWDMSDTGDIKIDLKKGLQTLDGNKALQLVRFRKGYANGDVGRIQVQQMFLKALATKVLSTESIVKNLGDYIKVMYKYVDTDVSLSDALKYANYITKIDMSKMTMETLPGVGQYISGVSYFIHDPAETTEVVDRLFYNVAPAGNTDSDSSNSKDLTIEVSNGGTVAGLAARFTELLKNEGYTVTEPTNYTGEKLSYTRILVKNEGVGQDLVSYFKDARVEVLPNAVGSADIRIVLGTNEQ